MQRVLVAGEAIEERLLGDRRILDDRVGRATRRLVARRRAGLATEPALAAKKDAELVLEQHGAALVGRRRGEDHERAFALVVDRLHARPRRHGRTRRNRPLHDLEILLPVEQHHRIEAQAGEIHHAHERGKGRHDAERRQRLQAVLVCVLEDTRARLVDVDADTRPERVEDLRHDLRRTLQLTGLAVDGHDQGNHPLIGHLLALAHRIVVDLFKA